MRRLIDQILCLIGFHDFRIRKNGASSEKVCMRPTCDRREKLYAVKDSDVVIWNRKRIRNHNFTKRLRETEKQGRNN